MGVGSPSGRILPTKHYTMDAPPVLPVGGSGRRGRGPPRVASELSGPETLHTGGPPHPRDPQTGGPSHPVFVFSFSTASCGRGRGGVDVVHETSRFRVLSVRPVAQAGKGEVSSSVTPSLSWVGPVSGGRSDRPRHSSHPRPGPDPTCGSNLVSSGGAGDPGGDRRTGYESSEGHRLGDETRPCSPVLGGPL